LLSGFSVQDLIVEFHTLKQDSDEDIATYAAHTMSIAADKPKAKSAPA
jgi:hypothetical protein